LEVPNRAQDWFKQAESDLRHAERSRDEGSHDWACFAAQQAAEKAVKALHQRLGQEAWGHVVAKLLRELPAAVDVTDELVQMAQVLDGYYIPPRYPNGHPSGAPFEHYGPLHSDGAIRYAREILEFVRPQMA